LKTTSKVPVFDGEKEFTNDPEWVDNREEGRRSHALAVYDWRWKMEALVPLGCSPPRLKADTWKKPLGAMMPTKDFPFVWCIQSFFHCTEYSTLTYETLDNYVGAI